jgi:hypothetical protein
VYLAAFFCLSLRRSIESCVFSSVFLFVFRKACAAVAGLLHCVYLAAFFPVCFQEGMCGCCRSITLCVFSSVCLFVFEEPCVAVAGLLHFVYLAAFVGLFSRRHALLLQIHYFFVYLAAFLILF